MDLVYTENYGKIHIDDCGYDPLNLTKLDEIQEYLKSININRYIIKIIETSNTNYNKKYNISRHNYNRLIIDNYGDYISYTYEWHHDSFDKEIHFIKNPSKYILPNIIIDIIKSLKPIHEIEMINTNIFIKQIEKYRVIAEDYYKRFCKMG